MAEQVPSALNLKVSALFTIEKNWKLFVAPSVGVAAESGADWGDSMVYGATVWASRRFYPSLTLSLASRIVQPDSAWMTTARYRMFTVRKAVCMSS